MKLLIKTALLFILTLFVTELYGADDKVTEKKNTNAKMGCIQGVVIDKEFNETLPGAAIQIIGSTGGTITDIDGLYKLENLAPGEYKLRFTYISYEPIEMGSVKVEGGKITEINVELGKNNVVLNEVAVIARKRTDGEGALLLERKLATVAVESMGAKEMSLKGISNVEDGVKKITGISTSGSNQVFVRGLGDRYSITTLNGLTIASPNPDYKLIPLNLFASSVVNNIRVSKVYNPSAFGDYAGAHIDVETRENQKGTYLTLGVSTGMNTGTTFKEFRSADMPGSVYWGFNRRMVLPEDVKNMLPKDFSKLKKSPFNTNFSSSARNAAPELGLNLEGGHNFQWGEQKLSLMFSAQFSNDYTTYTDAFQSTLTAQGVMLDAFTSDKWNYSTTATAFGQVGYTINERNRLGYNVLYVNKTEDNYATREGFDAEGMPILANNSVYRIYNLLNNQLFGVHDLGSRWNLNWRGAFGKTSSDEPDRRQIIYVKNDKGDYELFKLNQQETSRFFGELDEKEWSGNAYLSFFPQELSDPKNKIRLGVAYKQKNRDFESYNFYYNLKDIDPVITDIYDPSFINDANIANGSVSIKKVSLPRNNYYADSQTGGAFVDFEYLIGQKWFLSGGLRYEYANQTVRYWTDAGKEMKAELKSNDLFPAINVKYMLTEKQNLFFSASRTVTRPSFIEMSPFEYKESYGGSAIRGYADLKNGYNYNVDLRYEIYPSAGDLISVSGYYKLLDSPIERVQEYAGAAINTFRNVKQGQVAGVELEYKKSITQNLRVGFNGSYIYTHIQLPEGGVYTDTKRNLQGASPYLINADINWIPYRRDESNLSMALVYNLRGPRIHSVGINGVGNVVEQALNTLDFNLIYQMSKSIQMKLQAKNLLNSEYKFKQEVADTGESKIVERYKKGTSFNIGFNYTF